MTLVDPTAARGTAGTPAPRLRPGPRSRVALVDAMLHKKGQWGQGLLDAAQDALRALVPTATFDRVTLDPITPEEPDVWATAMASRYHALVLAAGD